jgi:hypothetical protein
MFMLGIPRVRSRRLERRDLFAVVEDYGAFISVVTAQ